IDKDKKLIAGHGRVMAAKQLGMEKVPCIFVEGLSDEQYKAYILADNKLTELGEWDMDLVAEELRLLNDADFDIDITGFTLDDTIIDNDPIEDLGIGNEIDEMLDDDEEPYVKRGEIYQLGNHRLMCGDSTNLDDVLKLCDENVIDLVVTDPPYNVAVENSKGMKIANDNMSNSQFYEFLYSAMSNISAVLKLGGVLLCMAR
ncbi:MAG: DNA modification methylase, partial [Bacteroidales bacterium]|nr:DNA modification methylase [Candidatus Scybalousia scybalohippi]